MDPRVSEYLQSFEAKKAEEDKLYRESVMRKAGLMETFEVECSESEFIKAPYEDRLKAEKQGDEWRFILRRQVPIQVTDDEFASIEKIVKLQEPKETPKPVNEQRPSCYSAPEDTDSGAAAFFKVLAWIVWIGGLIFAVVTAFQQVPNTSSYSYRTTYRAEFSFTLFLTTLSTYAIYGAVCMAASELFRQLQTIVNLLRRKG